MRDFFSSVESSSSSESSRLYASIGALGRDVDGAGGGTGLPEVWSVALPSAAGCTGEARSQATACENCRPYCLINTT
jgi:hypothetical protein